MNNLSEPPLGESGTKDVSSGWSYKTFQRGHVLTRPELLEMFQGEVAGIRIPGFLSSDDCASVVQQLKEKARGRSRQYKGGLNIGTAFDINHWEETYIVESERAWHGYFRKVGSTTRLRRQIFRKAKVFDPVDQVVQMLAMGWGAPVSRLSKCGKKMYAGMIRSGAPKLHFDNGLFDVGEIEVVGQGGINIYLANGKRGGDLRVYRKYGMTKGNHASSKNVVIGNYDLAHSLVDGIEACTIPCRVGDFVVAPNRFLHEVTPPAQGEENRLSLSFHLALLANGKLAIFS